MNQDVIAYATKPKLEAALMEAISVIESLCGMMSAYHNEETINKLREAYMFGIEKKLDPLDIYAD